MDEIEALLASIEEADETLAKALDARAKAYGVLARMKEKEPDLFVPVPRDSDVIAQMCERVKEFPVASIEPALREILGACEGILAPRRIAYLGDAGGFAHLAARRHFGSAANYQAVENVEEMLGEISQGRMVFGVLPLETSTDGAVTATLLGLEASDVRISGELSVDTSYHLLSGTGNVADVEKVYGARAALAACGRFLRAELPRATVIDVPSIEVAAELVREDHGAAIVGTKMLCDLYSLRVTREGIQDSRGVHTRYAIVGRDLPSRTGSDRTIVAVAVHDAPGALYETLKPFASRDVNLTRLESRPTPQWRYLFFLEMDGHVTDRPVLTALEELRKISRYVKVLGSYPQPGRS
ncbi:MAG: prephenate dehydratase domain-containing protein [Myxococcota bacterium]